MPKLDGYVCEAGCGETLSVPSAESIGRHGWFTTFTPPPQPTLYTCGASCLLVVAQRIADAESRHLAAGAGR